MHRAVPSRRTGTGVLLLVLAGSTVLGTPLTAAAHGDGLNVVVVGQREGHIVTEVTWENDGDAVEEQVAATVNAVSPDGNRTAGPWRLVRDPSGPKNWTTAEALPSGNWKVTVEVGFPELGRAERELTVNPAAPTAAAPTAAGPTAAAPTSGGPTAGASAPPPSSPASPTTAAQPAADAEDAPRLPVTAAAAAALAVTGAGVWAVVRRSRARRHS
ncbi:hypothetical protein [Streptomyces sp. NPDC048603]|uniref:hypothetical protein n=1 Tax=Streptomyces sp. NPDC048603 TaxID=3365577 RepID=UPI0037249D67